MTWMTVATKSQYQEINQIAKGSKLLYHHINMIDEIEIELKKMRNYDNTRGKIKNNANFLQSH